MTNLLRTLGAGLYEMAKMALLVPLVVAGLAWVCFGWALGCYLISMGWTVAGGLVIALYVLMWAFMLGDESLRWDSRLPWRRR
jgi:hypothetical protein